MRLNQIHLKESNDVHSFIVQKWDGHSAPDLHVNPFDVMVKYIGSTDEGGVDIVGLTAHEPVKMTVSAGANLEHLTEQEALHALVIGRAGTGVLSKVKAALPNAAVLNGASVGASTKGALQIFNFFEDHLRGRLPWPT